MNTSSLRSFFYDKLLYITLIFSAIMMMCITPLLVKYTTLSITADTILYSSYGVNVMVESTKAIFCMMMYIVSKCDISINNNNTLVNNNEELNNKNTWINLWKAKSYLLLIKSILAFSIPAGLYVIDNNLVFVVLTMINPTTLHLFGNIKIFIIACLSWFFLKKNINSIQWSCLFLLITGLLVAELDSTSGTSDSSTEFKAFLLVFLMCLCAAIANIYLEYMYKQSGQDLLLQNFQLYCFGTLFNLILFYSLPSPNGDGNKDMLAGFDIYVWLIVLFNSFTGIIISLILKYLDNITNMFAHSGALVMTAIISKFLFGTTISKAFVYGAIIVSLCAYIYHSAGQLNSISTPRSNSTSISNTSNFGSDYESVELQAPRIDIAIEDSDKEYQEVIGAFPNSKKVSTKRSSTSLIDIRSLK